MQQKLETRAFDQVALQPGEQPLVAARALIGAFSASRLGTAIKMGANGGLVGHALTAHKKQFVVVTDRRVVFLSQTFMGGPGKTVLGELPRGQVTLAEAKMGTISLLRLAFGNEGDGVSLTFPRIDKKNAEALAAALQQTAVA